jgi:hypothetical protein
MYARHIFPRASDLDSLLLLLLANTDVQVNNNPAEDEQDQKSTHENQRLPELGGRRVLVGDDEITLAELVDYIDGDKVKCRASDSVHEGAMKSGGVGDERDGGLEIGDAGIVISVPS